MKYERIEKAVFLERPNRFIAYVNRTRGTEEKEVVHVKNTREMSGSFFCPGQECTFSAATIRTARRSGI